MTENLKSIDFIKKEEKYLAHNYAPVEVVIRRAKGCRVEDVEGRQYYDFLSAYSAVNQGHCHPRIVKAMIDQASICTLTSRAFYNDCLGDFSEYMHKIFGYDKVLPMNSGVEACETANKLARKWAYKVKGIKENQAVTLFAENNFWGRSIAAVSSSTDPLAYKDYGPFVPNFKNIPYDDAEALENECKNNPNICAFMLEPVQGEAGVVVPSDGYLKKVRDITKKYNVLMIVDEVQTGLGRTGKLLCSNHENVRPDIVTLGKAMSGGLYPISAVLCDDEIMLTIKAGEHGSTYGGNPLACKIAKEAISTIIDEKMCEKSMELGAYTIDKLKVIAKKFGEVNEIRGKGLMIAIVLKEKSDGGKLSQIFASNGLLAKCTHSHIIRLAPPLIITKKEIDECLQIIEKSLGQFTR
ncbi:hypothetical protein SNEBB_011036 [Seison nebaliae]|nr:hypothetical protein SNEBB_011036 [Seison nebaliae]